MPPLADECLFLDINKLKLDGMLTPGYAYHLRWWRNGEETGTAGLVCDSTMRIRLLYRLEGPYIGEIGLDGRELAEILEDRDLDDSWLFYPVWIVHSSCHFGGWRSEGRTGSGQRGASERTWNDAGPARRGIRPSWATPGKRWRPRSAGSNWHAPTRSRSRCIPTSTCRCRIFPSSAARLRRRLIRLARDRASRVFAGPFFLLGFSTTRQASLGHRSYARE
jgi:hypothetical protein